MGSSGRIVFEVSVSAFERSVSPSIFNFFESLSSIEVVFRFSPVGVCSAFTPLIRDCKPSRSSILIVFNAPLLVASQRLDLNLIFEQSPSIFIFKLESSPMEVLQKWQAGSGLVFGSFLSLHMINIYSVHFGESVYNTIQDLLRFYYRNPFIEPIVVFGSLGVHLCSAMGYIVAREQHKPKNVNIVEGHVRKLHRYTGYILVGLTLPHIWMTRSQPNINTSSNKTLMSIFHMILAFSGVYHMSYGYLKAARIFEFIPPLGLQNKHKILHFDNWIKLNGIVSVSSVLVLNGVYNHLGLPKL
eukprot:TRINITY_DN1806_c0_g1_i5.p1 TRINITY_DN1806_c0_g1~~TRINITY_DN1806_c0_g1_i5.p1  ORF type:complete len:300 (+),score=35.61 TRINITY_DN1806_c0_g1_i5:458-1357(+)